MLETNRIIVGDSAEVLATFPDACIDLTVTSPPYDNLRTYNGFTFDFEAIARQLYRVTKPGGVVVWVVGDATIDGSETGTSFRQALFFKECGFNLHDTMIYKKQSPAYPPDDEDTRYGQVFEYMFVFSKTIPKTANKLKDKKNRWSGYSSFGTPSRRKKNGDLQTGKPYVIAEYSYRENIWEYHAGSGYGQVDKIAYKQPATFPEALARDHILSWSNPGDVVLDPFAGSGTTLKAAMQLERQYIGIELSAEYVNEIILPRLNGTTAPLPMFAVAT